MSKIRALIDMFTILKIVGQIEVAKKNGNEKEKFPALLEKTETIYSKYSEKFLMNKKTKLDGMVGGLTVLSKSLILDYLGDLDGQEKFLNTYLANIHLKKEKINIDYYLLDISYRNRLRQKIVAADKGNVDFNDKGEPSIMLYLQRNIKRDRMTESQAKILMGEMVLIHFAHKEFEEVEVGLQSLLIVHKNNRQALMAFLKNTQIMKNNQYNSKTMNEYISYLNNYIEKSLGNTHSLSMSLTK